MRHLHCLLRIVCIVCCFGVMPPLAHAASAKAKVVEDTAFVQATLTAPVWHTDPLRITFRPDETQCRKAYGENWEERCFVAIGMFGAKVTGLALTGNDLPTGEWRWEDYATLAFTPKSPWQAKTAFTVDMSKLTIPLRAKISSRMLKGSTLPLAGQSPKGEVWIDPSASGPRAVSFALRFTAPVDKSLGQAISVKASDSAVGLGKMQIVWGQDNSSCVVKVPLTTLSENDAIVTLQVAGVRPLSVTNTTVSLLNGTLTQTLNVPGKKQLFRVSEAELKLETTEQLAREYRLGLKTSLRVPVADLLKALTVVELPRLQNPEATEAYAWNVAPAITQADLAKARPLKVELVRDPGASGEPVLLRVPATPGSYVYCMLPAGFGPADYSLAAPWTAVFQAPEAQQRVNFLQPGNVLTLMPHGDNRLDIVSSGVDAVRWRASRFRADNLNLLQIMSYAENRFAVYNFVDIATTAVEGTISLSGAGQKPLAPSFSTLALTELMRGATGFMYVELIGMREGKEVAHASRLVLATDLGMVSKLLPDGARQVYVCSLSSGEPVQGAVVRILGANGQSVAEARSDAEGYALLPAVRGLMREKEAVALVASYTTEAPKPADAGGKKGDTKGGEVGTEVVTQAGTQAGFHDGGDLAWMALDDTARRVDYSRFPTQGQISSPDNINAYVFGQRGIFRPGESLRFGVIIRRGDWKALPADMPLVATLIDPAGRTAMRRTFTVAEGLTELSWTSQESSPTGRYRLDVTSPAAQGATADVLGSGAVRVEEFQPDTLNIRAEVVKTAPAAPMEGKPMEGANKADDQEQSSVPEGWVVTTATGAEVALEVRVRNFYGLPAEGRKIRAELSVRPAELRFRGFEDFTFPDMLPLGNGSENATATRLPESLTTAEGQALVPLPLAAYQNRTMLCRVLVEGFESDGGRAVTTEKAFLVSPLPVMLGYRLTGAVSSMNYVPQGTEGGLEFVALGPDVRPVAAMAQNQAAQGQPEAAPLRLSVAERRYVTVLATDAQGKYVYEEHPVDKEISSSTASLDAQGRFMWDMPTNKSGEFLLTVRDGVGTVMARIPFTVAGNDDVRPALLQTADALPSTQMRLRLDKSDYAAGDTVNIFLAAPYAGVGLISLERDRVAKHVWFKAPAGHSVHALPIPKDFEGRGYINVTMGRAITSPEIFMQPHSFAVAALTVNAAGRDMGLSIDAPREVLPGGSLKAKLTARHAGKALVFAVDEGVLQLTRFSTPDPLRYLLLDRALEVETDQLFDLLMPVHVQIRKRLPAFGGDMHMGGGRFQNPFKRRNEPPLAWWSGLVDVGPQGTEVSIPVPAYTNGQVRLMAVAVSADTVGATEASTVARAPLVISPQLPLMAAPGDSFEGGISLHNTTNKALRVGLKTEHTGLDFAPQTQGLAESVDIPAGKEIFLPLRMVAADSPGEASFRVVATIIAGGTGAELGTGMELGAGQGQEFRRAASVSVRPATLPRQEQRTGFVPALSALKDATLPAQALTRSLYPFKADAAASVSAAPLPPLRVLLRALAAYPYACVEQSISRAFPLVLLHRRSGLAALLTPPEINGKPRAEMHAQMLEQAQNAIRAGYKPDLGLAPWPDAENSDSLLTAYAGDYLLSLREAGLTLPGDLSTSFFTSLRYAMSSTPETLEAARAKAYGLWVLTRSGLITSDWLDSLHSQLNERWPGWEKDVTASLMAGSYAIMNMQAPAQQLLNAGGEGQLLESAEAAPLTALGARALHVAVLARHFPDRLADRAGTLASRLLEGVNSSRGSTLEAALGARALLELAVPLGGEGSAPSGMSGASGTKAGVKGIGVKDSARIADSFAGAVLRCTAHQAGFEPVGEEPATTHMGTQTGTQEGNFPAVLALSAPGCTQFSLIAPDTKTLDTPLYWEVSSDGYDRIPPATAATTGMEISRVLKQPDGTPLGLAATVEQGTVLRVELTARVLGTGGDQLTQLVLADLLPGGFELLLSHPEDALPVNVNPAAYNRLDRREDRVLAYVSVGREAATFVYHLRAVNRGHYALPAAYGEALYDRGINSNTAAGVISVQ